jgi:hypothetical protein
MADENNLSGLAAIVTKLTSIRASLDAAIGHLNQALAASGWMLPNDDPNALPFASLSGDSQPVELPRGAFLGKSLPAAIKLYLHAMKRKQTIREIATALREGGVESTSENFESVITGALNRLKSNGEVLRFKDGWALAEFYPEHLRNKLAHDSGTKRSAPKKNLKKTKKSPRSAETTEVKTSDSKDSGLERRIEAYLEKERKGTWVSAGEIVNAVNAEPRSFPLVMGRLVKKHGWEKNPEGRFRAPMQQVM